MKCDALKPVSEFYRRGPKLYGSCRPCVRAQHKAWRTRFPERLKASYRRWYYRKRGHALFQGAKERARERGLPFTITQDDIQRRVNAGRCEMTGIAFDLETPGGTWNGPSLDQIVPGAGYTEENTRVVLYALNVMLNTWGPDRVIEIADALKRARTVHFSS